LEQSRQKKGKALLHASHSENVNASFALICRFVARALTFVQLQMYSGSQYIICSDSAHK